MRIRNRRALVIAFLTIPVFAGDADSDTVFFDGDFDIDDWSLSVVVFGDGGSASGARIASGGNPNAYRQISINVNAAPSPTGFSAVWSFHLRSAAVHDPSTQGPITSIDYSEDARFFSGTAPAGQGLAPALRQAGTLYASAGLTVPETTWTAKQFSNLVEGDFFLVEDDLIDGTQHPDFSATGASIEFGFVRINSTAIGGIAFSTVAGLDNWSLTIHTAAPVPVIDDRGIALLALGLVLAGTWVSVRMSRAVAPR